MQRPLSTSLSLRDALLTLAVMVVWGTNFVVIRIGVEHFPPLLFACLRFIFALLPMVFFLKRPAVPWRKLAAYGFLIGAGQFGLLFIAIKGFITPGLASLVVQSQSFFTILLAAAITRERVQPFQIAGLLLAAAGIIVILWHTDGTTTPLGVILILGAATCWAGGNIVARSTPNVDMLAYVVWASLFAVPPLFALSWCIEGWTAIHDGLAGAPLIAWAAAIWQAAGLVLAGLCVNILWPKFAAIRAARHPPAA